MAERFIVQITDLETREIKEFHTNAFMATIRGEKSTHNFTEIVDLDGIEILALLTSSQRQINDVCEKDPLLGTIFKKYVNEVLAEAKKMEDNNA